MKMVQIIKSKDPMLWYTKHVGKTVILEREDDLYYWSRDNGGYINIIHKSDAVIINSNDINENIVLGYD